MYNVTLINLTADARAVAVLTHSEQRGLGHDALRALLGNFCAIDPVENASGTTEIRIKVRQESYLIRAEQGKLSLYDLQHRELPGQLLTLEQVMAELDGTAIVARNQGIMQARAAVQPRETPAWAAVRPPAPVASKPRLIALTLAAGLLLVALLFVHAPWRDADTPAGFTPVTPAESAGLHAALAGVYLTGNEPGQHGIVVTRPRELKLFELGTVEAPRVVYASYQLGRMDEKLSLATDQPGGVIEVTAEGNLTYGGEVYRRIP